MEPGEFVGTFMDVYGEGGRRRPSVLNLVWEASVVSGEPSPADDVSELRWFALDVLPPPEECAFRWVAPFLRGPAPRPLAVVLTIGDIQTSPCRAPRP